MVEEFDSYNYCPWAWSTCLYGHQCGHYSTFAQAIESLATLPPGCYSLSRNKRRLPENEKGEHEAERLELLSAFECQPRPDCSCDGADDYNSDTVVDASLAVFAVLLALLLSSL